jgi:hypothetical protein
MAENVWVIVVSMSRDNMLVNTEVMPWPTHSRYRQRFSPVDEPDAFRTASSYSISSSCTYRLHETGITLNELSILANKCLSRLLQDQHGELAVRRRSGSTFSKFPMMDRQQASATSITTRYRVRTQHSHLMTVVPAKPVFLLLIHANVSFIEGPLTSD